LLQSRLIKRIERIYRLRLLYALHITLYGTLMVLGVLTVDPSRWQMMMFVGLAWLPVLLAHTTAQTVLELRERRTPVYQPIPMQSLNRYALPIILYDEQGNPVGGDDSLNKMNYLPR
jgi:hypothetical protein